MVITSTATRSGANATAPNGAASGNMGHGGLGRNPKTGAVVNVSETIHPAFKTAKELQRRLNTGETAEAGKHKEKP
jgi:hypothetical protein